MGTSRPTISRPSRVAATRQPLEMSSGVTDSRAVAARPPPGNCTILGGPFVCLLKLSTMPVPTIATASTVRTTPPPNTLRSGAATVLAIHAITAAEINMARSASDT
ncbi:MAG: hypothetical protein IJ146_01820 [Kiritimatiellae bacterium]|nr:hypothetical protein [Kiritimatiellia bacterium]